MRRRYTPVISLPGQESRPRHSRGGPSKSCRCLRGARFQDFAFSPLIPLATAKETPHHQVRTTRCGFHKRKTRFCHFADRQNPKQPHMVELYSNPPMVVPLAGVRLFPPPSSVSTFPHYMHLAGGFVRAGWRCTHCGSGTGGRASHGG
jgi:hypothetical protein